MNSSESYPSLTAIVIEVSPMAHCIFEVIALSAPTGIFGINPVDFLPRRIIPPERVMLQLTLFASILPIFAIVTLNRVSPGCIALIAMLVPGSIVMGKGLVHWVSAPYRSLALMRIA